MNRHKPELGAHQVFERYATNTGLLTPTHMVGNQFFDEVTSEVLLAWGIFNPMGPTLSLLVIASMPGTSTRLLCYRMLNPWQQENAVVAAASRETPAGTVVKWLEQLFRSNGRPGLRFVLSMPTVITPLANDLQVHHVVPELFWSLAQRLNEDLKIASLAIREHLGKPWDRLSPKQALAALHPTGKGGRAKLTRQDFDEWYALVTDEQHMQPEVAAIQVGWDGAIQFQRRAGGYALAATAMPWAVVAQYMAKMSPWEAKPADEVAAKTPSFGQLVAKPELWGELDADSLRKFAPRLIVAIATANDTAKLPYLHDLYRLLVRRLLHDKRAAVVDQIVKQLPSSDIAERALLPVILEEPDIEIVSQATIELATLMPLINDDPMTGARYLVSLAKEDARDERIKVGILSGLLLMGDRRVFEVIERCWEDLSHAGKERLTKAQSLVVHAPRVEFYLEWLEALEEAADNEMFGVLAAKLGRLPFETLAGPAEGYILEVERRFPATHFGGQAGATIKAQHTVAEFGQIIGPRMQELARREQSPKVLPTVLLIWGIDPPNSEDFRTRAPELEHLIQEKWR